MARLLARVRLVLIRVRLVLTRVRPVGDASKGAHLACRRSKWKTAVNAESGLPLDQMSLWALWLRDLQK